MKAIINVEIPEGWYRLPAGTIPRPTDRFLSTLEGGMLYEVQETAEWVLCGSDDSPVLNVDVAIRRERKSKKKAKAGK